MINYTEKIQGDGSLSWVAVETDSDGNVTNTYMVYDDPFKKAIDLIDILSSASPEEISFIKRALGV